MLKIDESFFKGEERCGHFVEPIMKRAWAAEMEMLEDIRIVCEKHDIKWFAAWGTLLGAVRHGGFIPWDDDVDICMLRPDLERFVEIAEKELPEYYEVMNIGTKDYFRDITSWVTNTKRIRWDHEYIEKFHGFPYMTGIDIFPVDYISRDEEQAEAIRVLCKVLIEETLGLIDCPDEFAPQREEALATIEGALNITIDRSGDLKKQVLSIANALFSMFGDADADEVAMIPYITRTKGRTQVPKECYSEMKWMDFEGIIKVPVPVGYDEVLRSSFGDYMKIVKFIPHDPYPFFKPQQADLKAFADEHPEIRDEVAKFL